MEINILVCKHILLHICESKMFWMIKVTVTAPITFTIHADAAQFTFSLAVIKCTVTVTNTHPVAPFYWTCRAEEGCGRAARFVRMLDG